MYQEECNYLFSLVPYRAALHVFSVGTRVDVFQVASDEIGMTASLSEEFSETLQVRVQEIEKRSLVRPLVIDLCIELAEARVRTSDPDLIDYVAILGLFLYDSLGWSGHVEKLESFF